MTEEAIAKVVNRYHKNRYKTYDQGERYDEWWGPVRKLNDMERLADECVRLHLQTPAPIKAAKAAKRESAMPRTAHTSEPWETDEADHDQPYQQIVIRSSEKYPHRICMVWIDDAPVEDYNREQTANVRRIVACVNALAGLNPEAVPDLLAACREVDMLDLCEGYSLADSQLPQLWKALSACRNAKAT